MSKDQMGDEDFTAEFSDGNCVLINYSDRSLGPTKFVNDWTHHEMVNGQERIVYHSQEAIGGEFYLVVTEFDNTEKMMRKTLTHASLVKG